jgi:hypothetical protein
MECVVRLVLCRACSQSGGRSGASMIGQSENFVCAGNAITMGVYLEIKKQPLTPSSADRTTRPHSPEAS